MKLKRLEQHDGTENCASCKALENIGKLLTGENRDALGNRARELDAQYETALVDSGACTDAVRAIALKHRVSLDGVTEVQISAIMSAMTMMVGSAMAIAEFIEAHPDEFPGLLEDENEGSEAGNGYENVN